MEIVDIEIYSIVVILLLIADYCTKFKKSFNENTHMWFIMAISIFLISFLNVFMGHFTSMLPELTIIILFVLYSLCLVPMLEMFFYIRKNFLGHELSIKNKTKSVIILSFCYFFFLIFVYIYGNSNSVPIHLTSSYQYSKYLLITLIPPLVLFFEFIYQRIFLKRKINIKIFIIPIICVMGVCTDVFDYSMTFVTASYTISLLILYICKFDQVIHIDPLTGLYNRAFLNRLSFKRVEDANKVLYMIDVDKFKAINDTHGHIAGDEVLIDISSVLRSSVRENDIVIRYGGDEFLIIASSKKDIEKIPLKINKNIDLYNSNHDIKVSLSIGSQVIDGRDIEEIIKLSDKKMYKNKAKK